MPRQHVRFPFTLEVLLEISSGKREARISDLSMGGCFIDCILDVNIGEIAVFDLNVPTGEWMRFTGEIVYVAPRIGFGIRFDELTYEQIFMLEQTIEVYGGDPYAKSD